jgi:hypothetical protein
VVLLRLKAARRLQSGLVAGGCASFAAGVGMVVAAAAGALAGTGAGLLVAGALAVGYGLLLVDDGAAG